MNRLTECAANVLGKGSQGVRRRVELSDFHARSVPDRRLASKLADVDEVAGEAQPTGGARPDQAAAQRFTIQNLLLQGELVCGLIPLRYVLDIGDVRGSLRFWLYRIDPEKVRSEDLTPSLSFV